MIPRAPILATLSSGHNRQIGGVSAARVGSAAGREEILVSSTVLDAAGSVRYGLSDVRSMTLKGVREAVDVRMVDWR